MLSPTRSVHLFHGCDPDISYISFFSPTQSVHLFHGCVPQTVYLRGGSALASLRAATQRQKLLIKPPNPSSHSTLTLCFVGFVGCLTSQQQASVSQGRICSDNFTCCHTEIEVADQTFYLTQSQYTDTGPTSPSADPITPGAWQGSHWSVNFKVTGMTRPRKNPAASGIRTRDLPVSRRTPYH